LLTNPARREKRVLSETYPLELHAGGMAGKCPRCKSISFEAVF